MIYTIGYARLTPAKLATILDLLRVGELLDTRSSPRTRVAGFGWKQLRDRFPALYEYRGDSLGGRAPIEPTALEWLAQRSREYARPIMLMCMEESPGECHRHHAIALPLAQQGAEVLHIYRSEVIEPQELQRSIDADDDYDCEDLFSHAAARAKKG